MSEHAPGLLLFGSDGGGEALAFDTACEGLPVVSVPFVGMDRDLTRTLAASFDELLVSMYHS